MIKVAIRTGESPERFLQRFKRICSKEGVLREIKNRSYYEKPSDKKRRREKEEMRTVRRKVRGFTPRPRGPAAASPSRRPASRSPAR